MSPAPWSPYGLEAHRVALLRRRQRLLLAAAVLAVLGLVALLVTTVRDNASITTFNGQGNTVTIELPGDQPRPKPTTLSVAPGRTTVLERPIQPEARPERDTGGEAAPRGGGINWLNLLTNFGPTLGAGIAAWRMARKRLVGGLEEVNLGVYKGALPYEMHTAQHKRWVFTKKQALAHLFGKGPGDLVAARPLVVGRRGAAAFARVR